MSGISNVANGNNALFHNTSRATNTTIGVSAMEANIDRSDNTAIGFAALAVQSQRWQHRSSGAAVANVAGSNNPVLGTNAGNNVGRASNVI
jgi:hypothetical protein